MFDVEAGGEAGERAVFADDAMARNYDGQRIKMNGHSHRPRCFFVADFFGNIGIAHGFAEWNVE